MLPVLIHDAARGDRADGEEDIIDRGDHGRVERVQRLVEVGLWVGLRLSLSLSLTLTLTLTLLR